MACIAGLSSYVVAQPGKAAAEIAAQKLAREVAPHLARQGFDRATLPLYHRAVRLDQRAHNDTLLARHSFAAGRTYLEIGQLDSAAALLRQSRRASLAATDTTQAVKAANYAADTYARLGLPDSAKAVMRWLQGLYPHTKPGTRARDVLDGTLGGYYQDKGQYALALRHRLAQLAYRRQRDEPARVGVTLSNIGELFYLQGQLRQSLRYRFEGLRYVQRDPAMRGTLPQLYAMLGKTYRDLGQLDSARLHYEIALRGLESPAEQSDEAALLHSEISMVLGLQGHLGLARQHSRQALAYCVHSADLDGRAQVYYYAGDVELRARNYPAARQYLRRAYELAQQLQSIDRLEPIAQLLARAEAATGHYAEAYRLRDLSAQLLDSVHVTAGQQAMAAMEARYQNQDKQRKISLLDRESRLRTAEATSQRRAKYLAWAGVAGLLLVVGFIGFLLRQRQRTAVVLAGQNATLAALNQRLDGANQSKVKLFSIISHDLRAPVGNLFQLLEIEEEAPDLLDPATRQAQTAYLRQTTRDLLDTMEELLLWSKDQLDQLEPERQLVRLPGVLVELAALYAPLAQGKNVALSVDCPPDLDCRTDPNFLRVILRNLVQNAIKFTPAGGQVSLAAAPGASGGVVLRVRDTGPGLTLAQLAHILSETNVGTLDFDPAHGLGLRLTREFVDKLGGTLTVNSVPGAGSMLEVSLPK